MPISHNVQSDLRRVVTTVTGDLTLYHLKVDQAQLWERPELAGFSELFDLRKSTLTEMFMTEVIQYAAIASNHIPHERIALLVASDIQQRAADTYAAARSFRENRVPCAVFRDEAEALAWLDQA